MTVTATFLTEIVAQAHVPQLRRLDAPARPGFFARLLRAMQESRLRQAELELARHAGLRDMLTDDVERKIGEAMFGSGRPLI